MDRADVPAFPVASDERGELLPQAGRTVSAAQRRYLTSNTPWRSRDVGRTVLLGAVSLFGLAGCWYGAGGEPRFRDQVGWVLGSFLSVTAAMVAGVLWLTAGFREVRRGVKELKVDKTLVFDLVEAVRVTPTHDTALLEDLVTGESMTRLHRPSCLLVRGKDVHPVSRPAALKLERCGVCLP
jgi:hypothetical protein